MRDGHYSQRVRRLKRLYCAQRDALCKELRVHDALWVNTGLSVLLKLPDHAPDVQIAREAMTGGMAQLPLPWPSRLQRGPCPASCLELRQSGRAAGRERVCQSV